MKSKVLFALAACVAASALTMAQAPAAQGRGQGATLPPVICQGAPGAAQALAAQAAAAAAAPGRGQGGGRGAAAPAAAAQPAERTVTVTAIPGVIAAGARFTQVFSTFGNAADGIIAAPDGSLLVNQEDNNAVIRIDQNDKASIWLVDTNGSGSLSMDRQGRIFAVQRIAQPGTPAAFRTTAPKTAGISQLWPERKMLADTFSDGTKWDGRPNDLSADSTGGAYFTQGCVYYASADGKITLVGEDVRTNGIVLSHDDKRLFVTNGTTLVAWDVQGPGRLTNKRTFATLEGGGNGDGITVDSTGRLYVSSGPGVQVFTPEGKYLGLIPTPRGLTGEVFAGPDKKTLYVVGNSVNDAYGQTLAFGRTIYKIPMLAEGMKGRSK